MLGYTRYNANKTIRKHPTGVIYPNSLPLWSRLHFFRRSTMRLGVCACVRRTNIDQPSDVRYTIVYFLSMFEMVILFWPWLIIHFAFASHSFAGQRLLQMRNGGRPYRLDLTTYFSFRIHASVNEITSNNHLNSPTTTAETAETAMLCSTSGQRESLMYHDVLVRPYSTVKCVHTTWTVNVETHTNLLHIFVIV